MEQIFNLSDHTVKNAVLAELSRFAPQLAKSPHGWFVAKNIGLNLYKQRPNDCNRVQHDRDKKKRIFSDFIDDRGAPPGTGRGEHSFHKRNRSSFSNINGFGGGRSGIGKNKPRRQFSKPYYPKN